MTGIQPRSLKSSTWHSPYAQSSEEALSIVAATCKDNKWHVLYKPHPQARHDCYSVNNNHVTVLPDISIYELLTICDVCITIVSQVAYEACILNKPVVLMGRLQLTGKDIAFEALDENSLQLQINAAITEGYSAHLESKFIDHTARLLRYYLFGFDPAITGIIGRTCRDAAKYICTFCRRPSRKRRYPLSMLVRGIGIVFQTITNIGYLRNMKILIKNIIRHSNKTRFVTRSSEKPEAKAAGGKGPEAC